MGAPASGSLTRLRLDESADARRKGGLRPCPRKVGGKPRQEPAAYKVLVSERERAEIETRTAATGLSVSVYLRNLGLGFQPHSTLDQEAILALLKVNADQGRLGGLFKPWMSGQSAPSAETPQIRTRLAAIEERL